MHPTHEDREALGGRMGKDVKDGEGCEGWGKVAPPSPSFPTFPVLPYPCYRRQLSITHRPLSSQSQVSGSSRRRNSMPRSPPMGAPGGASTIGGRT